MPSSTLQLIQASEPKYMGQILATLAVSLGPFAAGLGKGYSSPALASLQSLNAVHQHHHQHQRGHWGGGGNSSAPIRAMAGGGFSVSNQEGSWIASLSLLGALFGGPLGGVAMRYGRKRTLLAIAIPFSFFWLLTVFANSVAMMYVTAFGCGFCSAIVLLVSHVYISEIASPEIRGGLCALAKMASHVGLLVSFSLGAYLDWRRLAMVVTAAPLTLLIAAFYVPETPSCLSLRGREDEAAESLQWLRGEETDVRQEWNTIQANVRKQKAPCSLSSALSSTSSGAAAAAAAVAAVTSDGLPSLIKTGTPLWKQKRLLRPVLTTCGVMLFHRMSGAHAFNFYAVPIFRASFAGMDPHGAAVIVAFVQLLASITSGLLVDTIGRLPLLIASNLFMTLALAAFGTFIYMEGGSLVNSIASAGLQSNANSQLDWIPLVCVLIFTVAFSIGVGPIAWLLISELYPLEYRGVGGAITSAFSYACAFVSVKTFVDLESAFGLHGAFWIYAIVSLLGLVFVLVFVPETRGRGLDEMTESMADANLVIRKNPT
ncbi:facilitated trehalose transporter Tret1-like [Daphnia carinata]|uniref:facilitated trehalose transporter Tret1-like n=1 Tax=Daphnia carinata TaxID=120202 RepID=UPI00257AECA2|nr:facilitated trehalose transporter Tret1-like [Daphnia carinata]